MNMFEYTLMPDNEVRGRRWICTDIKTMEGKLVHPLVFKLHRIALRLRIFFLGLRLDVRRLAGRK